MPEQRDAGDLPDADWASDAQKNVALALAMAWGAAWLQPIQARLARSTPDLDASQRNALNALAQHAMRVGWRVMEQQLRMRDGQPVLPDLDAFRGALGKELGWIDAENLTRLHSQSAYYTLK